MEKFPSLLVWAPGVMVFDVVAEGSGGLVRTSDTRIDSSGFPLISNLPVTLKPGSRCSFGAGVPQPAIPVSTSARPHRLRRQDMGHSTIKRVMEKAVPQRVRDCQKDDGATGQCENLKLADDLTLFAGDESGQ